jgi:hypothetical protein
MRLAATDPLLLAAAASALPAFLSDLRRRTAASTLLACWIAIMLAAVLVWQYRNASYLLPLIPALAILTAGWTPFSAPRYAHWMLVVLAGAFLVKAVSPAAPWGLNTESGTVQPVAPALSRYCMEARGNPLIVVNMVDDLYAAALPLPHLRYALVAPVDLPSGPYGMPFGDMGISVSVDQFNHLGDYESTFRSRLRGWGISADAPIATLITVHSERELTSLLAGHPESDFLMPAIYQGAARSALHEQIAAAPRYFFLLSRSPLRRSSPPAWTCDM